MRLVKTYSGLISGIEKDDYTLFLGIPYAKPPVGALRWRAPQKLEPWEGIYQANSYPRRSIQETANRLDFFGKEFDHGPELLTEVSEDSLYLNIWTPAKAAGEKLPVAFWIHGGAYMGGFGHEVEFDGEGYCKRGVILVTINYRLGPMGFLAHPWLSEENRAEGFPAVSGNYGTLDQIAALKWVRENIAAFGGDPDNITAFGQSAGCESVQTLACSKLTRGMFAKAILQSGIGLSHDLPLSEAEQLGVEFAANAGAQSLDEMRALTPEQIMAAAGPIIGKGFATTKLPYAPVIDGVLLEDGYNSLIGRGKIHDIPYMVGSTMNDIRTTPEALARGERGIVYDCSKKWCQELLNNGRNPGYLYYFTRQLPGDDAGAFHTAEVWYTFGTYGRCWRPMTEEDAKLSADMMDYWTNFMKTGNPNGEGLPTWNPYRGDEDLMIFNV